MDAAGCAAVAVMLGAKLAQGRTAEIYAYEPGWVVKLLLPQFAPHEVQTELERMRVVAAAGVHTPAARELVTIDGRAGLVMQRVDAPTMYALIMQAPDRLEELAAVMARLHADLHTRKGAGLPHYKAWLAQMIARGRDADRRTRLYDALAALPDDAVICHGDVHPNNILMSAAGALLIDWVNAGAGHPCADVARTVLILRAAGEDDPDHVALVFMQAYLDVYFSITQHDWALVDGWLPVIAGARLSEGVTAREEAFLFRLIDARL